MAYTVNQFDTEHQGILHDIQYDYYGKRLATAGSDGKIQIFEIVNDNQKKIGEITSHESSVWQLSWSHPRFGTLLASCGFDRKVFIWRDTGKGWDKIFEYSDHKNSVNSLEFAPQEYGLILLCGSADGSISIHEYNNENWNSVKINGHGFGVNGVSWGPQSYNNEENSNLAALRFVSCGNDNLIRIWEAKNNRIDQFYVVTTLEAHEDVVRDVKWRHNIKTNYDVIVSGGDDCSVYLWVNSNLTNEENENSDNASEWTKYELRRFTQPISRLSWDEEGNVLAVTIQDGGVFLFRETTEGVWDLISMSNTEGVMENVLDEK